MNARDELDDAKRHLQSLRRRLDTLSRSTTPPRHQSQRYPNSSDSTPHQSQQCTNTPDNTPPRAVNASQVESVTTTPFSALRDENQSLDAEIARLRHRVEALRSGNDRATSAMIQLERCKLQARVAVVKQQRRLQPSGDAPKSDRRAPD